MREALIHGSHATSVYTAYRRVGTGAGTSTDTRAPGLHVCAVAATEAAQSSVASCKENLNATYIVPGAGTGMMRGLSGQRPRQGRVKGAS